MKRINLLPDHIGVGKVSRPRSWKNRLPAFFAAAVVPLWVVIILLHAQQINARIDYEAGFLASASMASSVTSSDDASHHSMPGVAVLREPLPPQAILALLSQQLPEGVFLHELTISIPKAMPDSQSQSDIAGSIQISFMGHAQSDASLPLLINRLAQTGVMQQVTITDNERVMENGQASWHFLITMQIDLEAGPASGLQGVAHADQ